MRSRYATIMATVLAIGGIFVLATAFSLGCCARAASGTGGMRTTVHEAPERCDSSGLGPRYGLLVRCGGLAETWRRPV